MLMDFGLVSYFVLKDMLAVEMIIKGNRWEKKYVFRWSEVVLNLLWMKNYDPTRPWMY